MAKTLRDIFFVVILLSRQKEYKGNGLKLSHIYDAYEVAQTCSTMYYVLLLQCRREDLRLSKAESTTPAQKNRFVAPIVLSP